MTPATRNAGRCAAARGAVSLLLAMLLAVPAGGAGPAGGADDDAFIASLAEAPAGTPVDRRRLAKLLFGVAATLESGRSGVRLLHGRALAPTASRSSALAQLETRYASYAEAVGRLSASVSRLLDEPQSIAALWRVLADGQRACWLLDLHNRTLDAYGVGLTELAPALASLEACARLRTAAFQPRVEALVAEALSAAQAERGELAALREELRELEQLVEDLRRIDAEP